MADILTNSKARRDYHILDTFEAGIVLHGTGMKSFRAGKGQNADALPRGEQARGGRATAHIDEYSHGNLNNHAPKAPRKLLLHRREIRKLAELAKVKGHTIVPLSFYWKGSLVKVQLAVGKGKAEYDKRDDIKKREADRELKQVLMHRAKGR